MYERCLQGGHFKKQSGGYFLFFFLNGNINFSDSEHSKVSKNLERSKLTDTSHETFFFQHRGLLNLTIYNDIIFNWENGSARQRKTHHRDCPRDVPRNVPWVFQTHYLIIAKTYQREDVRERDRQRDHFQKLLHSRGWL